MSVAPSPVATPAAQSAALELRDIHLPEAVSWWPPAPGWWILLTALVLLLIALIVINKIRARKRLQKIALTELEKIRSTYLENDDSVALVRSISTLMRRACLSFYPRRDVSNLTGEHWLSYLDKTASVKGFLHSDGKVLATAPYLPDNHSVDIDSEALLSLCEAWLRAQPAKGIQS